MATLQTVIDQIQAEVRGMSGVKAAPNEPPDQMNYFPFAVCYAKNGEYRIGPPDIMHGIHEIWLEIHVARGADRLDRDIAKAMVFAKSMPSTILAAYTAGTLTGLEVIKKISYEFGPLDWGGAPTLGFRFKLEGVKTQDGI